MRRRLPAERPPCRARGEPVALLTGPLHARSEFVVDLEPDTQLFSAKANTTVQTTSGQVWSMEDRRFYRGTVRGADSSFVHLRIALDGTVHGTMRCDDEM